MDKSTVVKNLDALKAIKGAHTFYDIHVHPYEVMFDACRFQPSPVCAGLYSAGATDYSPPAPADLDLHRDGLAKGVQLDKKLRSMACLLNARRLYSHTGPRVLGDQMNLSGIDKCLLLPVVNDEAADDQLGTMSDMFRGDDRFIFGYCPPAGISNHQLADHARKAVDDYGIRVLKVHPSVTGIDLSCKEGIERVESILDASKQCRLKVIVHGGMSPDCKNARAISYGTLTNLHHVDWSITPQTVVIAHGGCYGHTVDDACSQVVPLMSDMFARHHHLAFDTSGIETDILCLLLERFDLKRIYFGSDALYEKQWAALLRLWHALRKTVQQHEDALIQILGTNPAWFFGDNYTSDTTISSSRAATSGRQQAE